MSASAAVTAWQKARAVLVLASFRAAFAAAFRSVMVAKQLIHFDGFSILASTRLSRLPIALTDH